MDIIKLKTRQRSGTGKSYSRQVRKQGWIPANYYGRGMDSKNIEVDSKEFGVVLRAGKTTHLIDLGLSGEEGDSVAIVKEIQRDILFPRRIDHIDFQHTSMNAEVTVECPVEVVGDSVGVEEEDGVLNRSAQRLTVHCQARNIPEKITIDVSGLHVGDAIHVRDLDIANVTFKNSPDEVVVSVTHATKIEEVPVVSEEEGDEAAEGAEAQADGDKKEKDDGDKKEKGVGEDK